MVRVAGRPLLRRRLRRAARRPRRRKWPLAAALLLGLALLWHWWPEEQQPSPPPPSPFAATARALPIAAGAISPAPALAPARRRPPPSPRSELPEREALLAAVRDRSATLKDCAKPGDSLVRLPLRLHVGVTGAMKSLDFTGEPPAPQIASCVRRKAMGWSFDKIKLSRDVDLLVAVSFSPEPSSLTP